MQNEMVEGAKVTTKIHGRLTRRTIIRRMWLRGTRNHAQSHRAGISYVARRIGYDIPTTYRYLNALNQFGMIRAEFDKRSVVWTRAV